MARTVGNHEYSYFYDNNGNMTSEEDIPGPIREFTWNADDRLTEVVKDEYHTSSYVYDALGRRIVRTSGTTSTFYYYDGLTVIAEKEMTEKEGEWIWKRIFTVAPGVIGNIFRISEMSGGNWSDAYYHYDAIGNVVLRTNGYGGVLESLDQDAYGNVKTGSQTGYHLTTKEYDSIPELYYFNARWYDSLLGIFTSSASYPSYIEHPYNYAKFNPTKNIDPKGEIGICEAIALCGLGCGAAMVFGEQDWADCVGGCLGALGLPINKYVSAILWSSLPTLIRQITGTCRNYLCTGEGTLSNFQLPVFPGDPPIPYK